MKKIILGLMMFLVFALTSCNLTLPENGGTPTGGNNTPTAGEKTPTGEVTPTEGKEPTGNVPVSGTVLPLKTEEQIRANVGSYSQTFTITTFDGVYNYVVKADASKKQVLFNYNDNEFFAEYDSNYTYLVYYSNEYGSGYCKDYRYGSKVDTFYIDQLFDLSHDVAGAVKYQSKKDVTYAGRAATEYVLAANQESLIPADTKLTVVLDNETGAILKCVYDHINFYETTSFTPNDTTAEIAVAAKRATIEFDWFDVSILTKFGYQDIDFSAFDANSAGIQFSDDAKTVLYTYSVEHLLCTFKEGTPDVIVNLAKYVYSKGAKLDYSGYESDFEELYEDKIYTYGVTNVHCLTLNAYMVIDGVYYNVYFQGRNDMSNPGEWYVSFSFTNCGTVSEE